MLAVQAANPRTLERYDVVHMDNDTQPITFKSCQLIKQSDVLGTGPLRSSLKLLRTAFGRGELLLVWIAFGVFAVSGIQLFSVRFAVNCRTSFYESRILSFISPFLRPDPFRVCRVVSLATGLYTLFAPTQLTVRAILPVMEFVARFCRLAQGTRFHTLLRWFQSNYTARYRPDLRSTTDTEPNRLLCRRRERVTSYNPLVRDGPLRGLVVSHARHSNRVRQSAQRIRKIPAVRRRASGP